MTKTYSRCASCRWWERDEIPNRSDWGTCNQFHTKSGKAEFADVRAEAQDDESYEAFFATQSDFGCIDHDVDRKPTLSETRP